MSKTSHAGGSPQNIRHNTAHDHLTGQAFSAFDEDLKHTQAPDHHNSVSMLYSEVKCNKPRSARDMLASAEDSSMQHHHPHHGPYNTFECTELLPPNAMSYQHRPSLKQQTRKAFGSDSSFSSDDGGGNKNYENAAMIGVMSMGTLGNAFLQSLDYDDTLLTPEHEMTGAAKGRNDGATVTEGPSKSRRVVICDARGVPEWVDDPGRFACAVNAPSKRSKFGGMKSYLAYELTSSSGHAAAAAAVSTVSRRYKQFVWLRARLGEKFPAVAVPRLPGTLPAVARYEPACVRRRVGELSLWLEYITGHPALARCEVLRHFLTCGENSEEWKRGKRRAEKDRDASQRFYLSVDVRCSVDVQQAEELAKSMKVFHVNAEISMDELRQATWQAASHLRDGGRRSTERLALALGQVGATFSVLGSPAGGGGGGAAGLGRLGAALVQAGNTIRAAGLEAVEHARVDSEPLNEAVAFYGGLTCGLPELLKLHTSALSRVKEAEKRRAAGRASNDRSNTVLCVCMAEELEVSRAGERIFKRALALFLEGQLSFHRHMVKQLEECLQACAYE